jgi:hypothetical protein
LGVGDVDSGGAGLCEGDRERAAKGGAGEDGELAVKDVESADGHGAGRDGTQREEPSVRFEFSRQGQHPWFTGCVSIWGNNFSGSERMQCSESRRLVPLRDTCPYHCFVAYYSSVDEQRCHRAWVEG